MIISHNFLGIVPSRSYSKLFPLIVLGSSNDNEQDYIASSPQESISLALPMEENPLVLGLQLEAKKSKMAINVGIHVQANNGKVLNRSCWINEHGHIVSFYDKLHLFDYGALKESNSVEAGKKIVPPLDTVVGRVGLTICFDVSELRLVCTM
jgi:deaminated glutathione amidase